MIATPAHAQVAEIAGCQLGESFGSSPVYCDVTNRTQTAIAGMRFQLEIFEEGRTVPWVSEGFRPRPIGVSIDGGIEPGETRNIFLTSVYIAGEAGKAKLRFEVTPTQFLDVNDLEIPTP